MSLASLVVISLAAAAAVAAGWVVTLLRRRADEAAALRAQIARMRAVSDTAPGGYYYWDAVDGAERASPALAETLGAKDTTIAAFADLAPCFAAPDYTRLTALIGALRGQGLPFKARLALTSGRRELAAAGHVLNDSSGRTLGFIVWLNAFAGAAGEDEPGGGRSAHASRDKLAEILDELPTPVWRRNESLDIVWWNAAFSAAVGGDADAAGGDIPEFLPLPFAPRARALAESARAANGVHSEVRALVIDGERRSFEVVERPVEGGMIGLARTPVAIWGPDRRLKFFNRAFTELFRFDESRLAAEPLHEDVLEWMREVRLIPEQVDFPAFKRRFIDMYTTLIEPVEELIHLPDGRTLRAGRSPHPLGGLLFFYEDVSDHHRGGPHADRRRSLRYPGDGPERDATG